MQRVVSLTANIHGTYLGVPIHRPMLLDESTPPTPVASFATKGNSATFPSWKTSPNDSNIPVVSGARPRQREGCRALPVTTKHAEPAHCQPRPKRDISGIIESGRARQDSVIITAPGSRFSFECDRDGVCPITDEQTRRTAVLQRADRHHLTLPIDRRSTKALESCASRRD